VIWRKFKLDWSYAVGELLIVVTGALIALAIDQWNDNRLERAEEIEALSNILADIQADQRSFVFQLESRDSKEFDL